MIRAFRAAGKAGRVQPIHPAMVDDYIENYPDSEPVS